MMSKLNKVLSLGLLGTAIALTSPVLVQAQEVIQPDTLTTLKKRQNLQLKTFTDNPNSTGLGTLTQVTELQQTSLNQITSVNELRDVQPTDWAYEALKSLVERYGCIVGYPDRTFRGNRALSRWEFAAGLNACLNTLEKLLQENVAVLREDLDKLQLLAQQFAQELATMNVRVSNLESRVTYLTDHQFATTTKLNGDVILVYSGVGGSEQADGPPHQPIQNGQITVNYRVRMNFDTSFTGQDQLRVRMQTENFTLARGGSNLTDFNFAFVGEQDNRPQMNKIQYRFPFGNNLTLWANAAKITLDDVADPLSPYASSFTDGSLSFFGSLAPIYLLSDNTGPGGGAAYNFTPELSLGAFYSAGKGYSTASGEGFFNGQYVAGTQLTYLPATNTGVAIAYARQYIPQNQFYDFSVSGFTGLANADNPFSYENREDYGAGNATSSDNIALVWAWQIAEGFGLEGWGMYTSANAEGGERAGDSADIWNWKVSLAFPNLFQEGNLGMLSVGQPPYAAQLSNVNNLPGVTPATTTPPWFVETFYVFKINDNISFTPGFWIALNPANDRDPLWVGALRSSFKF
ncbi:MAG: iron uptake porin [Merismopediaceae bacterium]|nr:iron uptake porin [Merismopediaceae bacterium]